MQIVGILVITSWCFAIDVLIFIPLKLLKVVSSLYFISLHLSSLLSSHAFDSFPFIQLRVPIEEERVGLDESRHGGHAFPEHALIMRTLAAKLLNKE